MAQSSTIITVGDRVTIKMKKDKPDGIVRFIGQIQGKKGIYYGIELDDNNKGKNNGSIHGTPYFKCKSKKGVFVTKSSILKTDTNSNHHHTSRQTIGDTIMVDKVGCHGIIRYIGTPYTVKDKGIYYGVQLEKPKGKNNGTINGRWFFTCPSNCGIFINAITSKNQKNSEVEANADCFANNNMSADTDTYYIEDSLSQPNGSYAKPIYRGKHVKQNGTLQTMVIHSSDSDEMDKETSLATSATTIATNNQYNGQNIDLYDDDMDDMDDMDYDENYNEEDGSYENNSNYYAETNGDNDNQSTITPLPGLPDNHNEDDNDDEYYEEDEDELIEMEDDDDYDEDYNDYYDDTKYAESPPKKKKYRESDSNIKPPKYIDAKKQKEKEIRDKYEKRYSKYDMDMDINDIDDNKKNRKNRKNKKNKKNKKKRITPKQIIISLNGNKSPKTPKKHIDKNANKNKNDCHHRISLSLTEEIEDNGGDDSHIAKEKDIENSIDSAISKLTAKELSLYYNKKTHDRYNEFEMNTYSSDSTSDSDILVNKYLNKKSPPPITPAPDMIDAKLNKLNKLKMKPSNKQKENEKKQKEEKDNNKKKKFTLKEFMNIDLSSFVLDNNCDNFDVAKAICKYYDDKCGDTDTVTIVSDTGKGPNTAYWSKGDYNRIEKDCMGKYIMIYRACKHIECTVKVKQDIFESCVKGLCMDNLGHSQLIADKLDSIFGEGCHVALASHDEFEVFCRYSDGYISEVTLPSNDFVVAWRR